MRCDVLCALGDSDDSDAASGLARPSRQGEHSQIVMGYEISGVVVKVGSDVPATAGLSVGDEVVGTCCASFLASPRFLDRFSRCVRVCELPDLTICGISIAVDTAFSPLDAPSGGYSEYVVQAYYNVGKRRLLLICDSGWDSDCGWKVGKKT